MRKKILITGVHTGLGKALAGALLDRGDVVVGVSRQPPEEHAGKTGFQFHQIDLSDLDALPATISSLLAPAGSIDLVILNAGILGEIKDLRHTSLAELRSIIEVNVWANKLLIDALLARHPAPSQVVAISSGAAFNGSGGWGGYSISKSALNLLVRVYAHEHPQTHFSAVAPGLVLTPMLEHVCNLPDNQRYPALARIRSSLGTEGMQSAAEAAQRLLDCLAVIAERPSGAFSDLRDL